MNPCWGYLGLRWYVVDINELKEIMKLFSSSDIDALEFEREGCNLHLQKNGTSRREQVSPSNISDSGQAQANDIVVSQSDASIHQVKSPIVGTFYRAPNPDADPFIQLGDKVRVGQTLCIIEAMKLMNEITTDVSGTVVEIHVESGQGVEYDQLLFGIQV